MPTSAPRSGVVRWSLPAVTSAPSSPGDSYTRKRRQTRSLRERVSRAITCERRPPLRLALLGTSPPHSWGRGESVAHLAPFLSHECGGEVARRSRDGVGAL